MFLYSQSELMREQGVTSFCNWEKKPEEKDQGFNEILACVAGARLNRKRVVYNGAQERSQSGMHVCLSRAFYSHSRRAPCYSG